MANVLPVTIPVSKDIETLRKHVVNNLTSLSLRIAQGDNRTAPMSMGGNRLTDVPDPSNATDAVNLRTLKKSLQGITHPRAKESANVYTIVWANSGTATGTAPPYIINPLRVGSPVIAKAWAINNGASATSANIYIVPGGTGTPAKILASDLVLPGGTGPPVSTTAFVLSAALSINDVLYAVISTAGGASNYTIELLVTP